MLPEEEVPDGTGDRVYYKKPVWQRNIAIAAGPVMNFITAAVILVLFVGIQGIATASLTLDEVVADAPAAAAGLVAGDTLVGADGATWTTWDEASAYFRANPGETIQLTYQPAAGGPERTVDVTLVENPDVPGSGYLGVRAGVTHERPGPVEAVKLGLTGFKDVVVGTFTGFWWLLSGKISATGPDGAVGPVGIIDVSRQAVQQDWYPILLAFLSFNLGLINLLPILPFDGGHIAMNVVEKIRGRRLDTRVFERLVAFGTVLLDHAVHLPDVQRRQAHLRRLSPRRPAALAANAPQGAVAVRAVGWRMDGLILVTGGAGFIGSHVVDALLMHGIDVRVLDDFSTGKDENLDAAWALAAEGGAGLQVIEGDVRDEVRMRDAMDGCAAVVHLAAVPSVAQSVTDPVGCDSVTHGGTVNAARQAVEAEIDALRVRLELRRVRRCGAASYRRDLSRRDH